MGDPSSSWLKGIRGGKPSAADLLSGGAAILVVDARRLPAVAAPAAGRFAAKSARRTHAQDDVMRRAHGA